MIKNLLKKKNNLISVIFLVLFFACKSKVNNSSNKRTNITIKKNDTIFFKTDDIFGEDWIISNRDSANLYRVFSKVNDSLFDVKHYTVDRNKLLSWGKLQNLKGNSPLNSIYHGTWYYYADGDMGVHKIGNYKKGKKSGSWFTIYEDAIPEVFYFQNDVAINYNDSLKVFDDKKQLIAYGKGTNENGVPKGKWVFIFPHADIKSERTFVDTQDKIIINYSDFEIKSNKLIEKGDFEQEK